MAWPRGAATGIGSLPGVNVTEAVKLVLGESPDLPYLPELPARGPGADMIGRSAALLVDFPVEVVVGRWQIASRPGKDLRRARDLWDRDLDALTEQLSGYEGPLKVQVVGAWTLAAALQLQIGGALLRDPGAVRDLAASLAEGIRLHVADVRRRVPGARVLVQCDEPSLPEALAGKIKSESGLGTLRTVSADTAAQIMRAIFETADAPVILHCCAADPPIELAVRAGAAGLAVDLAKVTSLDPLGEAIDAGLDLIAGVAPTSGSAPTGAALAERVTRLWRTLGFPPLDLPVRVAVAPACGLAGATMSDARGIMAACRDAGQRLAEA